MAQSINSYKTYERERRRVTIQSKFDLGMNYTNGAVEEGYMKTLVNYDLSNDGAYLIPRPGLRADTLFAPDWTEASYYDEDKYKRLVDCRECVESTGDIYRQFVIAEKNKSTGDYGLSFATVAKGQDEEVDIQYVENIGVQDHTILINGYRLSDVYSCSIVERVGSSVHGWRLEDTEAFDVIGTFAFGNSYYWFNNKKLYKSVYDNTQNRYKGEEVPVKTLGASEVVLYGYNMLSETPYTFNDKAGSGKIELTGILPYRPGTSFTELQMTPKQNESVSFRCYFEGVSIGSKYKFVWEWRTVNDSEWTAIRSLDSAEIYTVVSDSALEETVKLQNSRGEDVVLAETIKVPAAEVMIRVQAFVVDEHGTVADYTEEAMTMGFDFTKESYGANSNVQQEIYDLSNAKGITYWNNRLVLYGVTDDPTVLFISDFNEPGYFPYPNNITIYDEPIVSVKPFMGDLLVFTTSEIHRVALNSDGVTFKDVVVQTHLYIEPSDRSFIQVVKNMVFFKSGNYFYMMVPKAQATTGTLTLAPVSNNILEFFNKFEHNVYTLLLGVYDFREPITMYDYYNYLDYDDVHNVYVFKYTNMVLKTEGYLYLDIVYATNLRSWRCYVYEATDYLKPYRYDATQREQLVGVTYVPVMTGSVLFIELFKWDILNIADLRLFPEEGYLFPVGVSGNVSWTTFQKDSLQLLYQSSFNNSDLKKTFFNWQYFDTGYRNEFIEHMKRYREIQIQLNNVDGTDLEFGLDFYLDNMVRLRWYDYKVEHIVDEESSNYGQIYITRVEEPNIGVGRNVTRLAGIDEGYEIDSRRTWKLDQSQFPELSLWKMRMSVSGKGAAPRIKLLSKNEQRYELMSINWVCRIMNTR